MSKNVIESKASRCSLLGEVGSAVDYGLFWITSVGLLPRQQQLEKTRLPSRAGFCSNQGYGREKTEVFNGRSFIYAGIV